MLTDCHQWCVYPHSSNHGEHNITSLENQRTEARRQTESAAIRSVASIPQAGSGNNKHYCWCTAQLLTVLCWQISRRFDVWAFFFSDAAANLSCNAELSYKRVKARPLVKRLRVNVKLQRASAFIHLNFVYLRVNSNTASQDHWG